MKIFNVLLKIETEDELSNRVMFEGLSILLRLLSPIAPHITHHLWNSLNYGDDILKAKWPKVNPDALRVESIELMLQINGKLRGKFSVPAEADNRKVEAIAREHEILQRQLQGKTIKKVIVVPKRLVNIVIS